MIGAGRWNMVRKGLEECAQTYEGLFAEGDPEARSKSLEVRNVAAVKAIVEAVARDDYEALARVVDRDVRLQILAPPDVPFIRNAEGAPAFVDAVRRNFAMLEGQTPVLLSIVAQGEAVVVIVREQGRYVEEGRGYDLHAVQEFVFREGKLARVFEICARS
jgi:ketosteroid isomerase-like protein